MSSAVLSVIVTTGTTVLLTGKPSDRMPSLSRLALAHSFCRHSGCAITSSMPLTAAPAAADGAMVAPDMTWPPRRPSTSALVPGTIPPYPPNALLSVPPKSSRSPFTPKWS